jgi:hypothetical protein
MLHCGYGKKELSSSFDYAGPLTETILMGNLALQAWDVKDAKGGFSWTEEVALGCQRHEDHQL